MSSIQGKQWQTIPKKLNSYCDIQKYRALNITVTVRHFNGLVKKSMYFNKGYSLSCRYCMDTQIRVQYFKIEQQMNSTNLQKLFW